ncbi:metal ABC transporter ATP-binding protein [bacterium]|nr:MAG: metal ABC transporter ATP-binding protein [bacterium]QQR61570.1 MAG: metal ABC transporter ATP-binding protein [bacterium]QQR62894.1 MAG: metal ABC transporter ATP-binding protein [bacterium]
MIDTAPHTCILDVQGLTVSYDGSPVLDDLSFTVPRHSFAVIVGPNGGGKSTLMQALLGIKKPVSGSIQFHMQNNLPAPVAYVPQKKNIDWHFPITVSEVVMMGRYPYQGFLARASEYDKQIVFQSLKTVGMDVYADRPIGRLSGGQQQRVFFARALAQEPELYLLDEPFAAVDVATEAELLAVLEAEQLKGKTIIMVHHDLNTISTYADYIVLLNKKLFAATDLASCSYADLVRAYGRAVVSWHKDSV